MKISLNHLLSLGSAGLLMSLVGGAFAADVIVESRPEGQNNGGYQEVEGKWISSQTPPEASKSSAPGLTPAAQCGTRKVLFQPEGQRTTVGVPAAARFSPRLERPGRYYVYVTWPRGANARPVTYQVKHAGGTDEKTLMQDGQGGAGGKGNANQWILLSDYDFMPGADQYVELRVGPDTKPVASHLPGQVYADAVRFSTEPVEGAVDAASAGQPDGRPAAAPASSAAAPASAATPAAAPARSTGPEFQWSSDINAAMTKAAAEKKRVLVFFAAPGTDRSQCIEEEVFGNDIIRRELSWRYVPVRIDFSQNTDLASRYGVYRGGTVALFSTRGEKTGMITECLQPTEFLGRLQ